MFATEGWTIEGITVVPAPWGSPAVLGCYGCSPAGELALILVHEVPIGWVRPEAALPKDQIEWFHLHRFSVDARCATGREMFDAWTRGAEPPDFVVTAGGASSTWELTSFTIERRRAAHALFRRVRAAVATQQRHRVGHLTGFQINMWFGRASDGGGLPFQKTDHTAVNELVEFLVQYQPDPLRFSVPSGPPPKQLENMGPVVAPNDVRFFCVPLLGGVPASPLYSLVGFELGLSFQSEHRLGEEWDRLHEQIARKDRPDNDVLLISAGAPDQSGQAHPAEEVLAEWMLSKPQPTTATHLKAIFLHIWGSGATYSLLGKEPTKLWPALYHGLVPAHHPLRPQSPPDAGLKVPNDTPKNGDELGE
jgi:hypothetical protein